MKGFEYVLAKMQGEMLIILLGRSALRLLAVATVDLYYRLTLLPWEHLRC